MKSDAQREWEVREFDRLYERMRGALAIFGDDDGTLARGSYWIHEDYWGVRQIKVYVPDRTLTADFVEALRRTLHDMPDWEIVVACCPDDLKTPRAEMGLYVRHDVVLDGLIRALLPGHLKTIAFHLGRPIRADDQPLDWGDWPPTPNPFGVSA
ncbi:hypothetical protein [Phreatobacter cathodiphilus]|uniref:Uncharacterized protein n=1 Tax=Phreatobacter cathodiphilus TaxID=1868589 RepID=A0A2S0NFL7_9HYPH|nr:hypothetical protein [Phreatobacter cathodiphilus]AVO46693.1 hypothetical protein C6569_17390 [Phreatobacter cathodiphilus]